MAGNDRNTELLCHFKGANGSQVAPGMRDFSLGGRNGVATVAGTAQIDTSVYKWDASSLSLDGNSDYLYWTPCTAGKTLAEDNTQSWTIDAWIKLDNHAGTEKIIIWNEDPGGANSNGWNFSHIHNTGTVKGLHWTVWAGNSSVMVVDGQNEITDTNWHWVVAVKVYDDPNTIYATYLDGNQGGYTVYNTEHSWGAGEVDIGTDRRNSPETQYLDGHIGEIRIYKGNYFNASPNVGETDTITLPVEHYSRSSPMPCGWKTDTGRWSDI